MTAAEAHGRLGKPRGVVFVLLIGLITFGIYWLYWVFKTQQEMKDYSGQGLGGVLGLVVWILITPVSAFVIPSEIGNLYGREGWRRPVTGWTGLWFFPGLILVIPAIIWFVKVQRALNRFWASNALSAGSPSMPTEPVAPAGSS